MRLANRLFSCWFLVAAMALAHPMGNFSVSHYSRLEVSAGAVRLQYVLDLAEIPAFQELQVMGAGPDRLPASAVLQRYAERKAAEWAAGLDLSFRGRKCEWRVTAARAEFAEGAGGLPTMKVFIRAESTGAAGPGEVFFRDNNFPGRAGWKEIVITSAGVTLAGAEAFAQDISRGLAVYPVGSFNVPPQALEAAFQIISAPEKPGLHAPPRTRPAAAAPPLQNFQPPQASEQSAPRAAGERPPLPGPRPSGWGSVTRGDFLSRMLSRRQLGWRLILFGLAVAFCLGALHAFSPGHGKTIVAAYLVGSRGTIKHALFLGGVVTLTHTIGVFALGLSVLLAGPRIVPERLYPWLGVACGLSIVAIGMVMFRKRLAALSAFHHHDDHPHDHNHAHHHNDHAPHHGHGGRHGHSHEMPEKITAGSLLALGVSGGIIPCPSALVVLLAAISLNRAALGVLLILAFSLGLAVVLSSIGITMVQARSLFDRLPVNSGFVRKLPVFSSAVVSILGLGIAAQALMTALPAR